MPEPLSAFTTLRLGGAPARFVSATTDDDVVAAVREADERREPLLVLAGGSNVVVADAGFPRTAVHDATRGDRLEHETGDDQLAVELAAGEPWDPFVAETVERGLAGLECLSGIPGSVGATPIQNVGAYGQEVADTGPYVRVYDRREREVRDMAPDECEFGYRTSVFKRTPGRWVVLRVTLHLRRAELSAPIRYAELARALGVEIGDRAPLREVREAVLALRRRKGMVIDPADADTASAGSFFMNPVVEADQLAEIERRAGERPPAYPAPDGRVKTSAAWLIERAGYARGYGDPGGIAISTKHTLALTNRGAGTAAQLVALAREIRDGVRERFGVELLPEPVFVGHDWPLDQPSR